MKAAIFGCSGKTEKLIAACSKMTKSKPFHPILDACTLDGKKAIKYIVKPLSRNREIYEFACLFLQIDEVHRERG